MKYMYPLHTLRLWKLAEDYGLRVGIRRHTAVRSGSCAHVRVKICRNIYSQSYSFVRVQRVEW